MSQLENEVKLSLEIDNLRSQRQQDYNSRVLQELEEENVRFTATKQTIGESALDEPLKAQLLANIDELDKALASEADNDLKVQKFKALSHMLHTLAADDYASIDDKTQALDDYLIAFKAPTSRVKKGVTIGLTLAATALLIGFFVAAAYLIPLIPITAGVALLGLSGTGLALGAGVATFATKTVSLVIAMVSINLVMKKLLNPFLSLCQSFSKEQKLANQISQTMRQGFFPEEPKPVAKKPPLEDIELDNMALLTGHKS